MTSQQKPTKCHCGHSSTHGDVDRIGGTPEQSDIAVGTARGGEVIVFPQMNASNQQFEFIMSNSTGRSKNARKMVRSHVMSNFRRRQQLERVESLSLLICPKCNCARDRKAIPESLNSNYNEISPVPDPCETQVPSNPNVDPFAALPLRDSPISYRVLDHCNNYHVLMRRAVRREPGDQWSAFVMLKPGLLNASLVLAASHLMLIAGPDSDLKSAYFYHKMEAIRIVNECLGNYSLMTEDTIAVVALLTVIEFNDGDPEVARVHLRGLKRLISMARDDFSPLVHRLISLANILASEQPQQNMINLVGQANHPKFLTVGRSLHHESALGESSLQHPAIVPMFERLRNLALNVDSTNHVGSTETTEWPVDVDSTEKQLHTILHDGASFDWRAYFIAGTTYLYLVVQKLPVRSLTYDYVVERLKNALDHPDIFDNTEKYPPSVLFWILCIGGIASHGRPQREWFRMSLVKSRQILALRTWQDAFHALGKITPFGELESCGRDLWLEFT